ncbi:MAG: glycosyltransferase, partial [Pyrinomonadaceae bacterium]
MYVYRLSNALARRGHFVDVFHCKNAFDLLQTKSAPIPAEDDFPNHGQVRVMTLDSRAGFLSPLAAQQTGTSFFKRKIKQALENNSYDVIHYHNISLIGITSLSYGSGSSSPAKELKKKPIKLYTTHEHWLICPMHTLWKFDREVCEKKDCTACQIAGNRPPQLWRHTKLLENNLRNLDCLISPSRFTLKKHLDDGIKVPAAVIPNFSQLPAEIDSETKLELKPYFLFVGRLEKIKGLQNLIPIFGGLPEYDLYVAGDGAYESELKQQAKDFSNIKFLGKFNQSQ